MENYIIEDKCYRGSLVKIVVDNIIHENLFESVSGFKEKIENALNNDLNFKVQVTDLEYNNYNTEQNFNILYRNSKDVIKVLECVIK